MKAAISSSEPQLQSNIDPRFGRCAYFIFIDTDSGDWEAVPNANREAGGGAGIRTAQSIIDRGVEVVVTGNIGPNAMRVLSGQVKVYTGFYGTVEEAVQALKEGGMTDTTSPTVKDHAGMTGGGTGGGMPGGGMGGGMGGGPGGGMGGGPGGGMGGGPGGGMGGGMPGGGTGGSQGPFPGAPGTWRGGRGHGGGGKGGGRGGGRW
jgi:predicted Fe-Mo cluster-binding NifX family protein